MRGFLGGIVLGLVLCAVGLATLSLWSPLAPTPEVAPEATQPVAPTSAQAGIARQQLDPAITNAPPVSPLASKPEAGDLGSIIQIESQAMERPAVDAQADDPVSPEAPAPMPQMPAAPETVDPTNTQVDAPVAPVQDSDVGVDSSAPDVPAAEESLGSTDILFANEPEVAGASNVNTTRDLAINGSAPVQVTVDAIADAAPETTVDPAPQPQVPKGPEMFARSDIAAPELPGTIETSPDVTAPRASVAPVPDTATTVSDQTEQALPRIAPLPQAGVATETTGPTIGKRVVPLTERHKAAAAQKEDPLQSGNAAPLELYAEPFENLDGNPLMSIILADDGEIPAFEAVQGVPFPITVAIDPTLPNAAERMAHYRDAGHEVLMLVELPKFATARDVEVSLAAGFDVLPDTVGVLEGTDLQADREISAQVVAVANGTGRGLVTQNTGLNSSLKLAQNDGVPATAVYREFDRAGQDTPAIERSLDQAVFRASQDGSVTVIGRLHPATLQILQGWVADHRASRVALSPVSAVLRLSGGAS